MICSDKDVMRLECIIEDPYEGPYTKGLIKKVVARLRAAEYVIEDAEENQGITNPLVIEAWRETAGK